MDISQVKDEVAKGLRTFKAFEKGHEILLKLENIESELLEKTKIRDDLKEEICDIQSVKDAALAFVEQTKQKAAQDAENLINSAKKHVEDGISFAKDQAEKIIKEAKEAAQRNANIADDLGKANSEMALKIDAAKKELSTIESALAQHKSDMSKFLNGV